MKNFVAFSLLVSANAFAGTTCGRLVTYQPNPNHRGPEVRLAADSGIQFALNVGPGMDPNELGQELSADVGQRVCVAGDASVLSDGTNVIAVSKLMLEFK